MRYPEFLKPNGTIAFVAPSFGCAREPYKGGFLHAQEKWQRDGYQLRFGPNCYVEKGVGISNEPSLCGSELTDNYCNTTSDCIISCGGGELMCEILDYVDFERISNAPPKWFMGYSDNTNMTYLLATLCDTASIYGPCAASFGMEPRHTAIDDAMKLLTGAKLKFRGYDRWESESLKDEEHPLQPYNLTEKSEIKYILGDGRTNIVSLGGQNATKIAFSMEGRLLGGCLDCLIPLVGTKYDKTTEFCERYKDEGILWFFEACDMNLMGIRRALWQLEHAGWLKYCSGFLIGRPRLGMGVCEFGIDHYQAFYETLAGYHVPVLMDVDIGHLPPMIPLICGSMARVECDGSGYSVEMMLK